VLEAGQIAVTWVIDQEGVQRLDEAAEGGAGQYKAPRAQQDESRRLLTTLHCSPAKRPEVFGVCGHDGAALPDSPIEHVRVDRSAELCIRDRDHVVILLAEPPRQSGEKVLIEKKPQSSMMA